MKNKSINMLVIIGMIFFMITGITAYANESINCIVVNEDNNEKEDRSSNNDAREEEEENREEKIEYKVTFKNFWCKDTHPKDYPADAHFSNFVGAVHNKKTTIWKEGGASSAGMKELAEKGKTRVLERELLRLKRVGSVKEKFILKGVSKCKEETSNQIELSEEYPLVSIAGMIAPSPDWFTGISNVSLMEDGKWVDKKIVMVYAYDAGTKDGNTYTEKGKPTKPQDKIVKFEKEPFAKGREIIPVGCFIFVKDE